MKQKLITFIKRNRILHTLARLSLAVKARLALPIRGKGNRVLSKGALLNVKIDIEGNNNVVEIDEGAFLTNMLIYVRGNNNHLRIGAYCQFKGGCTWFEDDNGLICIGSYTSIESAHLAVTEPNQHITIGEDCMLSAGIDIRTGDSHSIIQADTGKRINYAQPITIGDHVWIGLNAVILKGVSIGNNSIVGMNALVTQSISDHCLAAGVPAKVIKQNVNWLRDRIYDPPEY